MHGEFLNVELVRRLRKDRGVSTQWLIARVGLSSTAGYLMFRTGLLPGDTARRNRVLRALGDYFDVEVAQLLLRLGAKQTA